jgi:hypothetical protein
MAQRPVNLTRVVTMAPPPDLQIWKSATERCLILRNATLGCALYLSKRGYILMQDSVGGVWVQHCNAPIIIQPPGGFTFNVVGSSLPLCPWLHAIQDDVRFAGRVAFDPEVPYVISVMRLYSGSYALGLPWSPSDANTPVTVVRGNDRLAGISPAKVTRALNPFVAQRCMSLILPQT